MDNRVGAKRRWEGGFVRKDAKGRDVYVIERMVGGKRYTVSTRAHGSKAALEHLARFERDPAAYTPQGSLDAAPIYLDKVLAKAFLLWSRDLKGNTPEWVGKQRHALAWWADRLKGRSLRNLSLRDVILPALDGAPGRSHRIRVLKVLYAWLRSERHLITLAEDPTFGVLKAPQSSPEQWKRVKSIDRAPFEKVRDLLDGHHRDGMDVLAATGWHVTELVRFARYGGIEVPFTRRPGVEAVLICPLTKGGEMLRTAVSEEGRDAAERLRAHGSFSRSRFDKAVKEACERAGVPKFLPGQMRHTVATWAVNGGVDPAAVTAFLGHKSPRTTRKFYATHATPKKILTLV